MKRFCLKIRLSVLILALTLAAMAVSGADTVQFAIGRRTPTVDGALTRSEYGAYVPYSYAYDPTVPAEKLAWSDRSPECYFAWDEAYFYAAMVSDANRLKAQVTERDGKVYADDSVELYLSGNGLKTPLHHFIVNSLGTIRDDRNGEKKWNARGVKVANGVRDGKWTIEIAVPWKALDITPAGESFAPHVNFCRNYHSGQGGSIKFIDMDENYLTTLAHGLFDQRDTQALVFLREQVPEVEFPVLTAPGPGENARTEIVALRDPQNSKQVVFWGSYPLQSRDPLVFRSVTTDIPKLEMLFMTDNNISGNGEYRIELDFRDINDDQRAFSNSPDLDIRSG